ncbi:SDR family NAD(P)-dependent oxidoreductase [Rhizobium halophytocola]|uniref:3-oxoacyl-[acyl-carrier protein] reductase n=1 Tax=Rhizobium halophytocola TaxID=735519 RepID=A0ABS4DXV2_9HYPH|nr:SDR family NAD(P)-dependent oxidoreductase [Rhizobium halophytocola]MBP1850518.1 3-oxoacyl-[acyl-carrier protein] reductase [Rhizobium halophytocola]
MELQLEGRTALVTGSSKGIGEAIARALAREKATVLVHGRDPAKTEAVSRSITAAGGAAHAVFGDLTRDDDVAELLASARRIAGSIDIVVNNAGGSGGDRETWNDTQAATWSSTYDRNVLAALRITAPLLPGMRQAGWGRVINISSLAAVMAPPSGPGYAAAKAGINALTASMAKAIAGNGITVNAVSPGTIHSAALDTRFRETAAERGFAKVDAPWEEIERAVLPLFAQVPVGRVGRLEDIADAVAFLASPLAGYITGINLRIDGGLSPSL